MTGPILQSGSVTPGHLLKWVTDGVAADGGSFPGISAQVLARLLGANFNTTNDQQIAIPTSIAKFALTNIIVTNANISLTTAVGGFYPQPGKAGSAIISAGANYAALTTSHSLINAVLTAFGSGTLFDSTNLTSYSIYLSLSTPQGLACTADVFLVGLNLS